MSFGAISRLKINLNKSEIILVGRVANVVELAAELGCGVGSLPAKQSFKRRTRKTRRFCVREVRRKPRGFEA